MVVASVEVGWVVAAIVVSYGLGCVPGARIVARRHGVDLLRAGDGNPGAWNALEQLGWRRAWPAFALDGLKGLLAAAIGWAVLGRVPATEEAHRLTAWLPWLCVAAAMLGHAFPIPRPAQGGKAVMTFAGGAVALAPLAGLPLLALFVVGAVAGRAALAARVAIFGFPFAQAVAGPILQVAWTGGLMSLFGLIFLARSRGRDEPPASSPGSG